MKPIIDREKIPKIAKLLGLTEDAHLTFIIELNIVTPFGEIWYEIKRLEE
jgi:hypothetical protein